MNTIIKFYPLSMCIFIDQPAISLKSLKVEYNIIKPCIYSKWTVEGPTAEVFISVRVCFITILKKKYMVLNLNAS